MAITGFKTCFLWDHLNKARCIVRIHWNNLDSENFCSSHLTSEKRTRAFGPRLGKVSRILQMYAFVSFHTETAYQLIKIGPRFYKNVIFFLFSDKRQQKLIIYC